MCGQSRRVLQENSPSAVLELEATQRDGLLSLTLLLDTGNDQLFHSLDGTAQIYALDGKLLALEAPGGALRRGVSGEGQAEGHTTGGVLAGELVGGQQLYTC